MSSATTTDKPTSAAARLILPRAEALRHLKNLIDKGAEIRALRIRNGDELDQARAHKLVWVQDVSDRLNQLFDNSSVADYVNDFVGKVFPEYAEFGNFVDQFYEEIDYRLNKIRTVCKRVETAGEGGSTPPSSPAGTVEQTPDSQIPAEETQQNNAQAHMTATATATAPSSQVFWSSQNLEHTMPSVAGPAAGGAQAAVAHKILFVSHGPHDAPADAVLQFMQQLGMPVAEADQTNGLIETLDARNDVSFVVLMNAEQTGDAPNGHRAFADSPMFKLGYCAGRLGLKRMCLMHSGAAQGDSDGIAHVAIDSGGGWQLQLARQMKRAGLDVDLNRLV